MLHSGFSAHAELLGSVPPAAMVKTIAVARSSFFCKIEHRPTLLEFFSKRDLVQFERQGLYEWLGVFLQVI